MRKKKIKKIVRKIVNRIKNMSKEEREKMMEDAGRYALYVSE